MCINYCIHIVSAHFVINMLPMFCIKKLHNHIRIFLVRQKHDINFVVQVFQVQSSPCFTTCLLENPSSSHFHFPQLHCSDTANHNYMYYRNIGWPLFKTIKTKLCDKERMKVDFTTLRDILYFSCF